MTKLLGSVQPRLFTEPLRPLNRKTSRGFEVVDFAEAIGMPLMEWQQYAAIHGLELLPDGSFRFRNVIVIVARQNGKSTLKQIVSLWRLYMDGAKLVLGVAQDLDIARYQFHGCIDIIKSSPMLRAELERVRTANGSEEFVVASGGRYKICTASRDAGRGLAVDEVTFDELRSQRNWEGWAALSPTISARPRGQIWAMSNAGNDASAVLNQLRDAALAGRDPDTGLFEWSAPDGCEIDDVEGWQQANPALGITLTERDIRSKLAINPPGLFRTEYLCQRVSVDDGAFDMSAWKDCADPLGSLEPQRKNLAACFDVAQDGAHATLCLAGILGDGRVRVEVARAWKSTEDARDELPEILAKIRPLQIGYYPSGPGGAFAPLIKAMDNSVELTGVKASEACQGLADLTSARKIVQPADPLLDAHMGGSQRLPASDGWRIKRRGEGSVDAAYACAGAVFIAQTMPPPFRLRMGMLG